MRRNGLHKLIVLGLTTTMILQSLTGCSAKDATQKTDADNAGDTAVAENSAADALLLTGKKSDVKKAQMPDDYVYSIDENGFVDLSEYTANGSIMAEYSNCAIDDNYRNFYEIFVMSFCDSDGDGVGDIKGVTQKLDYIQEMGFNGIWLMPVMEAPSYHKYDTSDYYKIDSAYGTNEDFEELIKEAHEKNIKVVIDFVINHSSSEHPWFTSACEYLKTLSENEEPDINECPYVGYYHFSREMKSGYCKVDGTDWYYEGVFNYTQPDLNFDSPKLRKEIENIAEFWTSMGVDGFRVDAAAHFEEGQAEYNKEVLNWLYNYCLNLNPEFYMVSEVWLEELAVADYYGSMTPSFFNFSAADYSGKIEKTATGEMSAESFVENMIKYQQEYSDNNPDYIDAVFITNHDMTRVATQLKNDEDTMKLACGLMMLMQGSTFVYYGEEIGMKSYGTADENKRTPINWDSDGNGLTTGPDGCEKIEHNFGTVEDQKKDPDSILNYYRRALIMRNSIPELARRRSISNVCGCALLSCDEGDGLGEVIAVINNEQEEKILDLSGTDYEDWEICYDLGIHPWISAQKTSEGIKIPAGTIIVLKPVE